MEQYKLAEIFLLCTEKYLLYLMILYLYLKILPNPDGEILLPQKSKVKKIFIGPTVISHNQIP